MERRFDGQGSASRPVAIPNVVRSSSHRRFGLSSTKQFEYQPPIKVSYPSNQQFGDTPQTWGYYFQEVFAARIPILENALHGRIADFPGPCYTEISP